MSGLFQTFLEDISKVFDRKFKYFDVGARWGVEYPWSLYTELISLTSFEPDDEEFQRLHKSKNADDEIFPYALGRENQKSVNLNLCKARGCSSLYEPNFYFLKDFPDSERYEVEKKLDVELHSLDSLYRKNFIKDIDFIKLDVQGAALDILEGGEQFLGSHLLGAQIEVEFSPLYLGQPLAHEIDDFVIKKLGLEVQDLRKSYWKYKNSIDVGGKKGKLIFGDALYFRSPNSVINLVGSLGDKDNAKSKLGMAFLMGIFYGYYDYSMEIILKEKKVEILSTSENEQLVNILLAYDRRNRFCRKDHWKVANILQILFKIFQPTYKGWGSQGDKIGNRYYKGILY